METVAEFVRRTSGPAVPFVPDWYPWVYAHHYLRLETAQLPPELARERTSLTATEARDVIQLWCALTGEGIEEAARGLADAYLLRWGLARSDESVRPDRPAVEIVSDAGAVPAAAGPGGTARGGAGRGGMGRARRLRRGRRRITVRRGRPGSGVLVPAGRRASAGS
jgi:hypothetical protein